MSDAALLRLLTVLLLLVCGCLLLLDAQRQRELALVRREVDNLHGRMNAAGLLATIPEPRNASILGRLLQAISNDQLSTIAREEAR